MNKKKTTPPWSPDLPPAAFSDTRSAAVAWLYALGHERQQDGALLLSALKERYPEADLDLARNIVTQAPPYHDIPRDLVEEVLEMTHGLGYEILPWREITMHVLTLDFLASLKSPSAQLTEDAIQRVTQTLDERLRGTTKNACQIIAGQRTKMRKTIRALALACLYILHYRPATSLDTIQEEFFSLLDPCAGAEQSFIVDAFPFEGFTHSDGSFNARGRFVLNEMIKFVRQFLPQKEAIDTLIQQASKKWRIARMSPIDLNIIRIAAYEILYEQVSQPRIFINEAVELSKCFGAEQSRNFVNGILQQLCNDNQVNIH